MIDEIGMSPTGDPFDALAGSRIPSLVHSSRHLRQATIQLRKRVPIDVSPWLGVRPFVMAKTLGCFLAATSRLAATGQAQAPELAARYLAKLEELGGFSSGGWGYEFDVQTRWAYYRAGEPNLIATVFVGRGLLEHGIVFGHDTSLKAALRSADYIASSLLNPDVDPFFNYAPGSTVLIHNANLLGAGFLAACGTLLNRADLVRLSIRCSKRSTSAVTCAGRLPYGEASGLEWEDNFHTAYDIDGLSWLALVGVDEAAEALRTMVDRWLECFFGPSGEPRYYSDRSLPYDIHSAATAVDVGARQGFSDARAQELALRVYKWTGDHLIDPRTGLAYYRNHGWWTDKRNFRRWGDAHWALARSAVQSHSAGVMTPIERALLNRSNGRIS